MWQIIALLAPDAAAIPFDLGKAASASSDPIVVTARPDQDEPYRLKSKLDPRFDRETVDRRLSADLGFGKLGPDSEQGRLGDTRLVIRLKVPF